MACVSDPGAFLRECFERMAGDEPGRFDIVFLEKFEEAWGTDVSSKETFFSPLDQLNLSYKRRYRYGRSYPD